MSLASCIIDDLWMSVTFIWKGHSVYRKGDSGVFFHIMKNADDLEEITSWLTENTQTYCIQKYSNILKYIVLCNAFPFY